MTFPLIYFLGLLSVCLWSGFFLFSWAFSFLLPRQPFSIQTAPALGDFMYQRTFSKLYVLSPD